LIFVIALSIAKNIFAQLRPSKAFNQIWTSPASQFGAFLPIVRAKAKCAEGWDGKARQIAADIAKLPELLRRNA